MNADKEMIITLGQALNEAADAINRLIISVNELHESDKRTPAVAQAVKAMTDSAAVATELQKAMAEGAIKYSSIPELGEA